MSIEDLYYSVPVIAVLIVGIKIVWGQYIKEKEDGKQDRKEFLAILNDVLHVIEKLYDTVDSNDGEVKKDLSSIKELLNKIYNENNNR